MKKTKLKEKGWSDEEINHAQKILEKREHHDVFFSKIVFWSALLVTLFANVIVSLILVPFLIVLNSWILFSLIILLGGTIGFLYNFLITDIGHLEKKHHLSASIIIPVIALANLVIMVIFSNKFIVELKINNSQHNPWIVAGVFVIAFILPYIIDRIRILTTHAN